MGGHPAQTSAWESLLASGDTLLGKQLSSSQVNGWLRQTCMPSDTCTTTMYVAVENSDTWPVSLCKNKPENRQQWEEAGEVRALAKQELRPAEAQA